MSTPALSVVVASVNGMPYLGKCLDAVVPSITFAAPVAKAGVEQPINADVFWRVTTDGSVTRYAFDLAGYFAACAAAGDGRLGSVGR